MYVLHWILFVFISSGRSQSRLATSHIGNDVKSWRSAGELLRDKNKRDEMMFNFYIEMVLRTSKNFDETFYVRNIFIIKSIQLNI